MLPDVQPNPWMMLPFGLLLGLMALAPLCFKTWWEKHYGQLTLALAAVTLTYYLAALGAGERVAETGRDYLGFISLIGSLFVVSAGIHLEVKKGTSPFSNTVFLFIGALLANLLGTTGASVLLIRPWLKLNQPAPRAHQVVFFIFIVANAGGCLTPLADPPLFLGYLAGVPFGWTVRNCFLPWLLGVSVLLGMFFVVDWLKLRGRPQSAIEKNPGDQNWRVSGWSNFFFLAVIIGALFIRRPRFLREVLMLTAALGSYVTTARRIHVANEFSFEPIKEVAILFAGIFATMMPAMDWLANHSSSMAGRAPSPALYFWATSGLSSVLDNAPTYLGFLNAFLGSFVSGDMLRQLQQLIGHGGAQAVKGNGMNANEIRLALAWYHGHYAVTGDPVGIQPLKMCFLLGNPGLKNYLLAISIGSVFSGAATYIGNGPNLLVKAIARQQRIEMPGFVGYILKYTVPFLLPTLVLIWLEFFRN